MDNSKLASKMTAPMSEYVNNSARSHNPHWHVGTDSFFNGLNGAKRLNGLNVLNINAPTIDTFAGSAINQPRCS